MAHAQSLTTSTSSMRQTEVSLRSISESRLVQLPKISDPRGNLTFVEALRNVPFPIRRAYWIYEVPGGEKRGGGHAYRTAEEFIIALSGSFEVTMDDGEDQQAFTLNRSYFGLYVPNTVWRKLDSFSTNAVCLILSSEHYDRTDYVREHEAFIEWRRGGEA